MKDLKRIILAFSISAPISHIIDLLLTISVKNGYHKIIALEILDVVCISIASYIISGIILNKDERR